MLKAARKRAAKRMAKMEKRNGAKKRKERAEKFIPKQAGLAGEALEALSGPAKRRQRAYNRRVLKSQTAHVQSLMLDRAIRREDKLVESGGKANDNSPGIPEMPDYDFSDAPKYRLRFWKHPLPDREKTDSLKLARKALGIVVKGGSEATGFCPAPMSQFTDDRMEGSARRMFNTFFEPRRHFVKPSRVQQQCWPAILAGMDVIGIAPTGSGKTLGYVLPAVVHIQNQAPLNVRRGRGPIALVLVPTRELTAQVCQALKPFSRHGGVGVRSLAVYGGKNKEQQVEALTSSGVHAVCATPGRAIDLISLRALSLKRVTYLVLDEADRMLNLGFEAQLHALIDKLRPGRQTLLFSATFPLQLRKAALQWMKPDAVFMRVNTVDVQGTGAGAFNEQTKSEDGARGGAKDGSALTLSSTVAQLVSILEDGEKFEVVTDYLTDLVQEDKTEKRRQRSSVLVFCNRVPTVDRVKELLVKRGFKAGALHGQLKQHEREDSLKRFKSGAVHVLVATDVAARGLHVKKLAQVINFDFPHTLEMFAHRCGRTGRQGAKGTALSLMTPAEVRHLGPPLVALLEGCGHPIGERLAKMAADAKEAAAERRRKAEEAAKARGEVLDDSADSLTPQELRSLEVRGKMRGPVRAGGHQVSNEDGVESDEEGGTSVHEQLEDVEKEEEEEEEEQGVMEAVGNEAPEERKRQEARSSSDEKKKSAKKKKGPLKRPRGRRGGKKNPNKKKKKATRS